MLEFKLFAIPFESVMRTNISTRRHTARLSSEELKYQTEKEMMENIKREGARAYLLRKQQEEREEKRQKKIAQENFQKQMAFCKRLEKHLQRD